MVSSKKELLNNSIWPMDRALTVITMPGQSGYGGNGNDGVLHIPQISSSEASSSDAA